MSHEQDRNSLAPCHNAISDDQLRLIKDYLEENLSPYLVYLFGSRATHQARNDSDLDLAFLSDRKLGGYEVFLVAQKLADGLGVEVDLVDLSRASTVMQMQVVDRGKVIYCTDDHRRQLFHLLVLKKYAKLNEERKCILDRIRERGSIYE